MNDVAITDQREPGADQREPGADQREPVLDHRELGRDMRIFESSPLVGPGLPLWLPAGAAVRYELEQYAREVALRTGCEPVYSPVLGKRSLFERSGHWAKFADDMFPPMAVSDSDVDPLVLRRPTVRTTRRSTRPSRVRTATCPCGTRSSRRCSGQNGPACCPG